MIVTVTRLSLLALVLTAVGAWTPGVAQNPAVSAQPRNVTRTEIDGRLALARSLAEAKKYEQALTEYLFVFDNSRAVSGYGGVRLSYVLGEIAALGRAHKPALAALRSRRDANEKLVLTTKADFDVIQELTSLNQYLDVPQRNVALFDQLKTMGTTQLEAREDLLRLIWKDLAAAKRYDELKSKIDELAQDVAKHVADSAINNDFPESGVLSSPRYQNYLRQSVIEDGGLVYETLLALGNLEKAAKLAKWMLTFSTDGEIYARLINSALNANRSDIAGDLVARAMKTLVGGDDLQLVRNAARRIPKAN